MSDWENEDFEDTPAPVIVPSKKWDDEDEDDEVKESWEDSDQEEEPVKKAPAPVKKIPLAQKIAEREARLKEEAEKKRLANRKASELTPEELRAQKEEQKRLQEESDLMNAADLFAGASLDDLDDGSENLKDSIDNLKGKTLKTKAQFDELSKSVSEIILNNKESRFYAAFIESLVREITEPMKDMDIRKIASILTASANEKQKAAKDALKKKKSKKPNAVVRADDFEGGSYSNDNYGGDYDDFM